MQEGMLVGLCALFVDADFEGSGHTIAAQ
jgi:hypothetical protein